MAHNTDLANLHPVMREKVKKLIEKLEQESIPLKLFEAYRSPQHQKELSSQGHASKPWYSYHQYGLACDFGLFADGAWSLETGDRVNEYWTRYQQIGYSLGLESLDSKKSYLQLSGFTSEKLISGNYPSVGDESWLKNFRAHIMTWTDNPKPSLPELTTSPLRSIPSLAREEKGTE
jgi:peptidoglycan L-alanyl-D-glutamate endopeptidase CwlK